MMIRGLFTLGFAWALAITAHAQLTASLRLSKTEYVAGETVGAVITLTNHSGRELVFHGGRSSNWLNFDIRNHRGEQVNPRSRDPFGAMKIGPGQSMSRELDLNSHFLLAQPGHYSVSASIRPPGNEAVGTSTNRVLFSLNPGRLYWSQKVGLPGRAGQTREFRVLQFSGSQQTQLYAQIIDDRTGNKVRTFPLGNSLSLRKPTVTIDKDQRMHVLFLSTPTMWVHYLINTDGQVVNRDIHQRGAQGDPKLINFGDGTVRVSNSIPYDPKAAAAARAQVRKASERPNIVYE